MVKIKSFDKQVNSTPDLVMKLPFSSYICGSKGQGKSTLLINLLTNPELLGGKFHQIYYVSPTSALDSKLDILKTTKNITLINKPLINKLNENKKKVKIFDEEIHEYNDNFTSIPEQNFIETPSVDLLENLKTEQSYIIKKYGKPIADNILIIFDDCIASKRFFESENVKRLVFNSRHFKISVIITSQNYKSLNKSLRLNMSDLLMYYTANKDEIKAVYNENCNCDFETFYRIFNETCKKDFGFLLVNYQNTIKYRFQNGFENFILID